MAYTCQVPARIMLSVSTAAIKLEGTFLQSDNSDNIYDDSQWLLSKNAKKSSSSYVQTGNKKFLSWYDKRNIS